MVTKRKRKRHVNKKQRLGNRRLWAYVLLYLVLAAVALYGGRRFHRYLISDPTYQISRVTIQGLSGRIREELAPLATQCHGHNIFTIDLGGVRDQVLDHPWVATAEVISQLPDTIKIIAIEKRPAGMVRQGAKLVLVAIDGSTITPLSDYGGNFDAPVITGIEKASDRQKAILLGLTALERIRQVSLLFWDNIESLDLSDGDNMVISLRNERAPIFLGDRVIDANIRNYLSVARHIQDNYPTLDYIELGFPNQIAIMPKKEE